MDHATGCTEQSRVPNCFACHMESEKEKYGDNVQFFSGDTLTVEVAEDGRLHVPNPHEEFRATLRSGPNYILTDIGVNMGILAFGGTLVRY